jgi:ribose transport system permease protein
VSVTGGGSGSNPSGGSDLPGQIKGSAGSPGGEGLPGLSGGGSGPASRVVAPAADEHSRVEGAAGHEGESESALARVMASSVGRNLGLVVALAVLCLVGVITAGDRFASESNLLTVLRLASVIGVVSVGMTFVIIGGGIDLSVGAIVALSSVWATTVATQDTAEDFGFLMIVLVAVIVGTVCGLVNGFFIAYGGIVPFIMTLAGLASFRGLAEQISNRQTQRVRVQSFSDFFGAEPFGVPLLVIMFVVAAAIGWVVLNRTTFGRRTFAVGGNAEAARLAGIDVKRHTLWLYTLLGFCSGIAAVMITARTTAGTSSHGNLYELDAIAAVVIGGTLLSGGRGTIVGTVFGVLIFTILSNIFTLNNLTTSTQAIAKGAIIVIAVLLQQRVARAASAP